MLPPFCNKVINLSPSLLKYLRQFVVKIASLSKQYHILKALLSMAVCSSCHVAVTFVNVKVNICRYQQLYLEIKTEPAKLTYRESFCSH